MIISLSLIVKISIQINFTKKTYFPHFINIKDNYNIKYERRDRIEIKIIGSDSLEGIKVKKQIKNIAKKQKLDINILEINDKNNIRKYKVQKTPTLVINDEIKYDLEKIDYNILKRLIIFCSLMKEKA